MSNANPEYITLNQQIDALHARLGQIVDAEWYDAQDYEETAEQMVSLQYRRDELLADILVARSTERFTRPLDRKQALQLAMHANESRDSRAWGDQ